MKFSKMLNAMMFGVALTGCGIPPQGADVAVADHADALTNKAADNIFVMTLTRSTKDYALAEIEVIAAVPGQTATVVNYTHNDTNKDGKLNQGESLNCQEPPVNLFDGTTVGKGVNVELAERANGIFRQIAAATWTPNN